MKKVTLKQSGKVQKGATRKAADRQSRGTVNHGNSGGDDRN
ncbi:MAG TPA: hypothetical protein VOA88_01050 [Candidatus Dormibacteraeota bacterium]|nr:hypothetical protein [Candidatus Dormibacteraeota bacterium]